MGPWWAEPWPRNATAPGGDPPTRLLGLPSGASVVTLFYDKDTTAQGSWGCSGEQFSEEAVSAWVGRWAPDHATWTRKGESDTWWMWLTVLQTTSALPCPPSLIGNSVYTNSTSCLPSPTNEKSIFPSIPGIPSGVEVGDLKEMGRGSKRRKVLWADRLQPYWALSLRCNPAPSVAPGT